MKITNTTRGDIGIQPELIVPAGGSIELPKDQEGFLKLPSVAAQFEAGRLVKAEAEAPAPKAAPKAEPAKATPPAPPAPKSGN